jgi:hypothetical protein
MTSVFKERATVSASSGVNATPPSATGTPKRRRISLAWYSWIFMD